MRKKHKLSGIYLAVLLLVMYLPIVMVVIFSFNESKLTASFTGFSLKWYETLSGMTEILRKRCSTAYFWAL